MIYIFAYIMNFSVATETCFIAIRSQILYFPWHYISKVPNISECHIFIVRKSSWQSLMLRFAEGKIQQKLWAQNGKSIQNQRVKEYFMLTDLHSNFYWSIIMLPYDCFLQQHFFHYLCTHAL